MKWVFPPGAPRGVEVPCGKCLCCLSNKRSEWAFRLMQEYKRSSSAAFITLTYHTKFLPDQGVVKRHFQLFMKRLRKKSTDRLRYYAVGEYGTKHGRPHYHAIIFNFQGNEKFLAKIWPFGIVHIGKVNVRSVMYTTKYVIQCSDQGKEKRNKPFALMSRRYGLGAWYLTDAMVAWHREDDRNYAIMDGVKVRLPRYYKDKIWPTKSYHVDYNAIRKRIAVKSKNDCLEAVEKNRKLLADQGYDPDLIMKDMRDAVMARIRKKVAFTQTL